MSVVYGIPFQDPRTAAKLRTVLHIANAMMIVALCSFILQIVADYFTPVSGLIIAIFIPLCGVFGAKYASRGLIACFVFSNIAVLTYWLVITIVAWGDVNPAPHGGAAYAAFALSACMAALQLAGAIMGARLLGDKYFAQGSVPVAQPIGISGGVPVQPAGEYVVAHAVILSPPPPPPPPMPVPQHSPPPAYGYPPPAPAYGYAANPYGPGYGQAYSQPYGGGYAGYVQQQQQQPPPSHLQQPTLHAGQPPQQPQQPQPHGMGTGDGGSGFSKGEAAVGRQRTASAGAPPVAVPSAAPGTGPRQPPSAPPSQGDSAPGSNTATRARNSSA